MDTQSSIQSWLRALPSSTLVRYLLSMDGLGLSSAGRVSAIALLRSVLSQRAEDAAPAAVPYGTLSRDVQKLLERSESHLFRAAALRGSCDAARARLQALQTASHGAAAAGGS
jgi:hypothetical protein